MGERCEIEIVRLGAQGDGIADGADGAIYVPRALPGERVSADIDGTRGRLIEVLQASTARATPPCPHFGACGGCAAQHMADGLYRDWKREIVRSAFAHRGLAPTIEGIVTVPPRSRRRATFAAERRGNDMLLGFHEEGSHALVDMRTCPVVVPAIEAALPALRTIAGALVQERNGVRLVVTAAIEGLDVAMPANAGQRIEPAAQARIAEAAATANIVRVTAAGHIVMQSAVPHMRAGGASIALPPAAFMQATVEAEQAIAKILAEAIGKARQVADLFAGLGTFTYTLAQRARVLAVDSDAAAIAALGAAAKATPGVRPIETRMRDLMREPLSRTELAGFDAVVLDPPRAGAKAQMEALARAKVPVVCAVSCNPATLARDCRILVDAGYAIERVVPIDQFVWSSHVEAVAVLRRRR